jgi:hypothetical protein
MTRRPYSNKRLTRIAKTLKAERCALEPIPTLARSRRMTVCPICKGEGWVCDAHRFVPWNGGLKTCCDEPGAPSDCNPRAACRRGSRCTARWTMKNSNRRHGRIEGARSP